MWIEEAVAGQAAQAAARHERVRVREGVAGDMLFAAGAFALRAPALAVKSFQRFSLGLELVLVAFDQFRRDFGIQLFEVHGLLVEHEV